MFVHVDCVGDSYLFSLLCPPTLLPSFTSFFLSQFFPYLLASTSPSLPPFIPLDRILSSLACLTSLPSSPLTPVQKAGNAMDKPTEICKRKRLDTMTAGPTRVKTLSHSSQSKMLCPFKSWSGGPHCEDLRWLCAVT